MDSIKVQGSWIPLNPHIHSWRSDERRQKHAVHNHYAQTDRQTDRHTHTHTHARTQLDQWLQAAQKERLELDPTYLRKIRELVVGELRNVQNSAKVHALGVRVQGVGCSGFGFMRSGQNSV
jgi:hypothetical protein